MLANPEYRKTDMVRDLLALGKYREALAIAKDFKILTKQDKRDIMRAHEVNSNPRLYTQMGFDPANLLRAGTDVLLRLYGPSRAAA